ncbi:unnamed protein product [Camellia sinensis]
MADPPSSHQSDPGGKPIDYEDHLPLAPIHIVTHASQLPPEFLEPSLERQLVIGFDCEGVDLCRNGTLCIMQYAKSIATATASDAIYLVDAIQGGETLMKACKPALESSYITKVIHDCKRDSEALYYQFGIKLNNVVDTQIAYSMIEEQEGRARLSDDYISFVGLLGDPRYCVLCDMKEMLRNIIKSTKMRKLDKIHQHYHGFFIPRYEVLCFDSTSNLNYHVDVGFHLEDLNVGISYVEKQEVRVLLRQDPKFWTYRPLSEQMVRAAADDVRFLLAVYHKMMEKLNQRSLWYLAVRGALYCRCFCISDDAYADWPSLPTVPDNLIVEGIAPEEEILSVLDVPPGKMGLVIGRRGASILAIKKSCNAEIFIGGNKGPADKGIYHRTSEAGPESRSNVERENAGNVLRTVFCIILSSAWTL